MLDADLEAPGSGVTALVGPSGSGKTTLLRCIAGLERHGSGICVVNGEIWQTERTVLPAHKRHVGYVFQEASLFPHLNVRKNIEFGMNRVPASDRRVAFDEAVSMLGIKKFLDSDPAKLSGGESRRVAIARALLTSPQLLMMDEPLSGLDEESKIEIMDYLKTLFISLQIPVIYVSHLEQEVQKLASCIVVMSAGKCLTMDHPDLIYQRAKYQETVP